MMKIVVGSRGHTWATGSAWCLGSWWYGQDTFDNIGWQPFKNNKFKFSLAKLRPIACLLQLLGINVQVHLHGRTQSFACI